MKIIRADFLFFFLFFIKTSHFQLQTKIIFFVLARSGSRRTDGIGAIVHGVIDDDCRGLHLEEEPCKFLYTGKENKPPPPPISKPTVLAISIGFD